MVFGDFIGGLSFPGSSNGRGRWWSGLLRGLGDEGERAVGEKLELCKDVV